MILFFEVYWICNAYATIIVPSMMNPQPIQEFVLYFLFKNNIPNIIDEGIAIPDKETSILGVANINPTDSNEDNQKSNKLGIHILKNNDTVIGFFKGFITAFTEYSKKQSDIPKNIAIVINIGCIKWLKYG